jgi:hypothetical protein
MLKPRSFPLILRLGLIVGVLLATLSVGTTLLIRSSKAASPIAYSPVTRTSVTGYWTKERMQNAIATSMPRVSTSSPTRPSTTTLAYSTEATATLATPVSQSDYATPPASFVGKVFVHLPSTNTDGTCTGTAIVSKNNSIVDTVAHCLYYDRAWSTNVMFCPRYYNGNTPGGCWSAYQTGVQQFWLDDQTNYTHDYGMIIVQLKSGQTLATSNGAAGYAPNLPLATLLTLTATAYGYPVPAPFGGEQMYVASGNLTNVNYTHGTLLQISNNDMNEGSSGGPWFVTYEGTLYLIGHTSTGAGTTDFSPYYGDEWIALLNDAQNVPNA